MEPSYDYFFVFLLLLFFSSIFTQSSQKLLFFILSFSHDFEHFFSTIITKYSKMLLRGINCQKGIKMTQISSILLMV